MRKEDRLTSKNRLDQEHIKSSPSRNADQRISFPQMENRNQKAGYDLRKPVGRGKNIRIPQTVDHQHPDHRAWQDPGKIPEAFRHRPVSSEHKKRQEPKRHGNRGRNCHDPYFMKRNHRLPPPSLETVLPPSKGRES